MSYVFRYNSLYSINPYLSLLNTERTYSR